MSKIDLEALKVLLTADAREQDDIRYYGGPKSSWTPCRDALVDAAVSQLPDLIAHIERLQNALKPFATFADTFVDADGWTGPMNVERIVDWFGPSDFREARSQGTSND